MIGRINWASGSSINYSSLVVELLSADVAVDAEGFGLPVLLASRVCGEA